MEQLVSIGIQDSAREPIAGVVEVTRLTLGARVGRSIKTLLVLWLVAIGCLPLPGLHFVLVPGFFVAGLVFAVLRIRATVVLGEQSLSCPKCNQPVAIEGGTTGWPAKVLCNECSSRLMLAPCT